MRTSTLTHALAAWCLAIVTGAAAQPGTLLSSEILPPGSAVTYTPGTIPGLVDTTSTGTGLQWDFSAMPLGGSPFTMEVLAPSAAPHTASVPGANYVIHESHIPRYSYFTHTPQDLSRVGHHVNGSLYLFTDPQEELVYPVNVGSANTDDWANTEVTFPGTYSYECIGSGSLSLPGAYYDDVILLRVVAVNIFSVVAFFWIDATNGAHLVMYYAPGIFMPEGVYVATGVTIGIGEHANGIDLRIPTLVTADLHVTYTAPNPVDWSVMDASGRLLRQGMLPASGAPVTAFVETASLTPGMHLFDLRDRTTGLRRTVRFVKE